jgi:c-di-GMP-related signal transduction protein
LTDIPLPEEIKNILQDNKKKSMCMDLNCIHKIIKAYEIADWDEVERISKTLNIPKENISKAYLDAIKWTNEVIESFEI